MVICLKAQTSITIDIYILTQAREKRVNISQVAEKALKEVLANSAAGNKVSEEVEKQKNISTLQRLWRKSMLNPVCMDRFNRALRSFAEGYNIPLSEAIKIAEER